MAASSYDPYATSATPVTTMSELAVAQRHPDGALQLEQQQHDPYATPATSVTTMNELAVAQRHPDGALQLEQQQQQSCRGRMRRCGKCGSSCAPNVPVCRSCGATLPEEMARFMNYYRTLHGIGPPPNTRMQSSTHQLTQSYHPHDGTLEQQLSHCVANCALDVDAVTDAPFDRRRHARGDQTNVLDMSLDLLHRNRDLAYRTYMLRGIVNHAQHTLDYHSTLEDEFVRMQIVRDDAQRTLDVDEDVRNVAVREEEL